MKNETSREKNMTEQKNISTNLRASGTSENCEWVLIQLIRRKRFIAVNDRRWSKIRQTINSRHEVTKIVCG